MKRLSLTILLGLMIASLLLSACAAPAAQTGGRTWRIATDATWFPFEYVDEQTREIVGFDIDLINAIAEKENLNIEILNVAWDPLLAGVAGCQYDAAISAMTITEERAESMLFSDPYFAAGQQIVVGQDNTTITRIEDLAGTTVGAQIGTTGAIELESMEGVTLRTYDEIGLAFQALMTGQIDAVVADDALAQGYIAQNPTRLKEAGDPFTAEYYGIAVCQNNTELLEQLNRGLAAVQAEGLIDELVEKWLIGAE